MPDASHLVGFFCDTPMVGSGYFGMLQMGLMARCRKAECELLIKAFDMHDPSMPDQVQTLISRSPLLGVVLTEPMCDMHELVKVLLDAGDKPRRHRIDAFDEHADTALASGQHGLVEGERPSRQQQRQHRGE